MPILPGATHYDDFNRPDSPTLGTSSSGHVWTLNVGSHFSVVSNAAKNTAVGGPHISTIHTLLSDGAIQATFSVSSPGAFGRGLCWRYVDSNNYWFLTNSQVFKVVAGSAVVVATGGTIYTSAITDVTVVLTGSNGKVYSDGVLVYAYTDATFQTATRHGARWRFGDSASWFDDWSFAASYGLDAWTFGLIRA